MPNPVPGTIVPTGALVSPGGNQGAGGPMGPNGPTVVSADAGNIATLGSDNLILVPQSKIWSTRLRSFNAVGNPNFEVDQRNVHLAVSNPANNVFACDRWAIGKVAATAVVNTQAGISANGTLIPGTNFRISSTIFNFVLATPQATLAAGDYFILTQNIEGSVFRELASDVHSVSILCSSTVANLKFALVLRDASSGYSLVKLCTIPNANTQTLIQLPNLPLWTPSGAFNQVPSQTGYNLSICLACGSSLMAPAADSWQSGNFIGAPGMSNWLASPANSYFVLQFVQHEPGPQCTQLMDKPFDGANGNLNECLRYFCKSYPYSTAVASASIQAGLKGGIVPAALTTAVFSNVVFPVTMAKVPTVTVYSYSGLVNAATQVGSGDNGVSSIGQTGEAGFQTIAFAAAVTAGSFWNYHYKADTGW